MSLMALGISGTFGLIGGFVTYANITKHERMLKKEQQEVRKKWLEALVLNGCYNPLGKTFDLLDMEIIQNGMKAISLLPRGLCLNDLKKRVEMLEDNLDARISIEKNRYESKIFIRIINNPPNFFYEKPIACDDNHIWIGTTHYGKDLIVELDDCPHYVFTGATGSGKTFMVATIITNLIWNIDRMKTKNKPIVYVSQIMKADWCLFGQCKPVKKVILSLKENAEKLEYLLKLANDRSLKMKERYVTSIAEWNKNYGKEEYMNRVFWLGDELAFFNETSSDSNDVALLKKRCFETLVGLARAGRSSGIHLFTIVQRPSAKSMGGDGELRSQMGIVTLYQNTEKESDFVIGNKMAFNLGKREALFCFGKQDAFVVPTLKNKFTDLKAFVPEIRVPEDYLKELAETKEGNLKSNENINEVNKVQSNYNDYHEVINIADKKRTREEIKEYMHKLNLETVEKIKPKDRIEELKNKVGLNKQEKLEYYQKAIYSKVNSENEKKLINFMDRYEDRKPIAMTLEQIHKILFFNRYNQRSSYSSCSRMVNNLVDKGVLKKYSITPNMNSNNHKYISELSSNKNCNEMLMKSYKAIYYIDKLGKENTFHDIQPYQFYIKLMDIVGIDDIKCELTPTIDVESGRLIPDAVFEFKHNEKNKKVYYECDLTHYTDERKIRKYEELAKKENFVLYVTRIDMNSFKQFKVSSEKIKIVCDDFVMGQVDKIFS